MPRTTPAAKQLISEVHAIDPDIVATASDEDGFGVHRTITFSGAGLSWLGDALDVISDRRIVTIAHPSPDEVVAVFVATSAADFTHPFNLPAVQAVFEEPVEPVLGTPKIEVSPGDDLSAPKKRTAKKTSAKTDEE